MKILLTVTLLLGMIGMAAAVTYEWKDNRGVIHFTDNPDKIPKKYRNRVVERESITGEKEVAPKQDQQPKKDDAPAPAATRAYGGHDEEWWRNSFQVLRDKISEVENGLAEKREKLKILRHRKIVYTKPSDRIAYNKLNADIEKDEARLKELEDKLAARQAEAIRMEVPQEWRK